MRLDFNHPLLKIFCYQHLICRSSDRNDLGGFNFKGLEVLKIDEGDCDWFHCHFRTIDPYMSGGSVISVNNSQFFDWLVKHRENLINDII